MELKIIFVGVVLVAILEVEGHGRCMDPVHRGAAWRFAFRTPTNFDDNELFCGGVAVQYGLNDGRCGACGDDYREKPPRQHENGGLYGTGTIVRTYKAGQKIDAVIHLTASHLGYFEFALCPLRGPTDVETEECFQKHPLWLANGEEKFAVTGAGDQNFTVPLQLPSDFTCEHCSFRWHYRTGNSWGICEDGTAALGCGDQEIFRSCSDIRIE